MERIIGENGGRGEEGEEIRKGESSNSSASMVSTLSYEHHRTANIASLVNRKSGLGIGVPSRTFDGVLFKMVQC